MLPHIQKPDGISKNTQYQFGGYDRRPEAADGTFYDTLRLSTAKAPLLSSRGPYSAGPGSVDYVFGNDARLMIRNGGEIWYNGFLLAAFEHQLAGRRAVRFGTSWIIYPDKVMIKLPAQLKGKAATVEALSTIQDPQEGDTWVVKGILEDNPYLYTYTGGAWVKGEKVLQDMEASVTLASKRASFGCQYGPWQGGQIREKIADWNVLRDNQSQTDWSCFKPGDAVTISGCTTQPKNNLTAVIREIKDGQLIFYENTFTPRPAYIFKVMETLPAEETDGGQTYKVWYQIAGDADPSGEEQKVNFTLPFDAEVGDVLVIELGSQGEMELIWNNGNSFYQITLLDSTPAGVKPQAEPTLLEFGTDEDVWHGSYLEGGTVTVEKRIPDMDYMFCDSNRLWGCKDSKIYASALGDPSVFYRFDGLSDDSWSVEVFSPGEFTGAISVDGYPTFFKENIRYKVYGSQPSAYQLSETSCDGVKEGSGDSLAIVEGTLYYVSPRGIMADTGAQPYCISRPLGLKDFSGGCAGVDGTKYVISLQEQETWQTFLYDTELGLWLRDESRQYSSFANVKGVLYGVKEPAGDLIRFDGATPGGWVSEGTVQSEAVTNDYVLEEPNRKGLHRVQIRTEIDQGASLSIYIRYDSGRWILVKTLGEDTKKSYYLPVLLRRCDHFALRFVGSGDWVLHSLALETVHGSAIH